MNLSYPENAIFILGAGRFGRRAAEILTTGHRRSPILVIDKDENALSRLENLPVTTIMKDALLFLADQFSSLLPSHTIVPSVPSHVAFEWLLRYREGVVTREDIPQEIKLTLPHTWMGPEGSLLVSYSDFLCPEDCPEPADRCTVTGKERGTPLNERLAKITARGYRIHVIRSRQLAPGVGGYGVSDLIMLLENLWRHPGGRWLLATACKCHGTVTAMSVRVQSGISEVTSS